MWELVIIWETGDKDIYEYLSSEEAETAGKGMVNALGKQIQWFGVRRKI